MRGLMPGTVPYTIGTYIGMHLRIYLAWTQNPVDDGAWGSG